MHNYSSAIKKIYMKITHLGFSHRSGNIINQSVSSDIVMKSLYWVDQNYSKCIRIHVIIKKWYWWVMGELGRLFYRLSSLNPGAIKKNVPFEFSGIHTLVLDQLFSKPNFMGDQNPFVDKIFLRTNFCFVIAYIIE